jgi:hypothetical protein
VPVAARQALPGRWTDRVVDWGTRFIDQEMHPWWLIHNASAHNVLLPMPVPGSQTETLLAAVL